MASDFKYIIFSIFDISDFNEVTDVVKLIFKRELEKGKAYIYPLCPVIEEYINPQSGGSHFPKFSCWQNEMYPDKVFFISNYEDGLSNLCRTIQKHLKCNTIMCALSNETDNPFFKFYFSNSNLEERLIQAYKEDRWVFYEEGIPLSIEDQSYYKNKNIKKRLNNSIIKEYLLKLGIDLCLIDSKISKGFVFIRKEW